MPRCNGSVCASSDSACEWPEVAPTRPVDATDSDDPAYDWSTPSCGARQPPLGRSRRRAAVRRDARLGERGQAGELRAHERKSFGAFARAAAHRYPWAQKCSDLERAEPGALVAPDIRAHLRDSPAESGVHGDPRRDSRGASRRWGTAPRGSTGGVSPVSWMLAMHRAHARLDAYAHNPYPLDPRTREPAPRRLHALHDHHHGDAAAARDARRPQLPPGADLADRVRLPDQSARSHPGRHACRPGALRVGGRVCRLPRAARRSAHPLPVSRRARRSRGSRAGSSRSGDVAEAGARRFRAAAGGDRAAAVRRRASGDSCARPTSGSVAVLERRRHGLADVRDGSRECRRLCPLARHVPRGAVIRVRTRAGSPERRSRSPRAIGTWPGSAATRSSHAADRRVRLEIELASSAACVYAYSAMSARVIESPTNHCAIG